MNVCLVEDDLLLGRALKAFLEDNGQQVIWVRMAADARDRLHDEEFDAALVDLGLPDGEGIDLVKQLRRQGNHLPILIITARDTVNSRIEGLNAGADDYLVKPFDNSEMLARLRANLRRGRSWAAEPEILSGAGLAVDTHSRKVRCDESEISLSPTEFAILCELLRRKNHVRTRRQLESVAMPDSDSQSLDTHMSNLRRKLGRVNGNDRIRTVRGVGYVIDD
ncbi:MAG: response regulator transcription factor [Gammaproteobacteria bacterium]|nr:response regulator transcription factor [Gammaproteobacteria bacterium]